MLGGVQKPNKPHRLLGRRRHLERPLPGPVPRSSPHAPRHGAGAQNGRMVLAGRPPTPAHLMLVSPSLRNRRGRTPSPSHPPEPFPSCCLLCGQSLSRHDGLRTEVPIPLLRLQEAPDFPQSQCGPKTIRDEDCEFAPRIPQQKSLLGLVRGRGVVPLWDWKAASHSKWRIHASDFLNHWTCRCTASRLQSGSLSSLQLLARTWRCSTRPRHYPPFTRRVFARCHDPVWIWEQDHPRRLSTPATLEWETSRHLCSRAAPVAHIEKSWTARSLMNHDGCASCTQQLLGNRIGEASGPGPQDVARMKLFPVAATSLANLSVPGLAAVHLKKNDGSHCPVVVEGDSSTCHGEGLAGFVHISRAHSHCVTTKVFIRLPEADPWSQDEDIISS